tara:strand:+ start:2867 stop:3100 length:234 start_codon:yes stop_codon:yes gene_type:complete
MEENQKISKVLEDCAEIAEKIKNNPYLVNQKIELNIETGKFDEVLLEIEEFVRVRVNRDQNKISLNIGDVEFIFLKN